jgi:hypothetical protein
MHTEALLAYLHKKHSICDGKLDGISLDGLHHYMKNQKPIQRASTAKLIHGWIPTNDFLHKQGRADSYLCPRCQLYKETSDHIMECEDSDAHDARQPLLYNMLQQLVKANTSIIILSLLERKLTRLLKVCNLDKYHPPNAINILDSLATEVTQSQNIIGWHNFLKGYISRCWVSLQHEATASNGYTKKQSRWDLIFTSAILDLHKKIWEDRNIFVHGKTQLESMAKLRQAVERKVRQLYDNHVKLAKRYQPITAIPLDQRLYKSTRELHNWIDRITHQKKVTAILYGTRPPGQLTLQQAYASHSITYRQMHAYPP